MLNAQSNRLEKHPFSDWKLMDWFFLAVAIFVVVWSMYRGVTSTDWRADGVVFYIAGHALNQGVSPYSTELSSQYWLECLGRSYLPSQNFYSPPTVLPIVWVLGHFSYSVSRVLQDAMNILALGLIQLALYFIIKHLFPNIKPWKIFLSLTLAALSIFNPLSITYGQISLLAVAGMVWALYFLVKGSHPVLFALSALLASMKPQLAFVPLLVGLVMRRDLQYWKSVVFVFALYLFGIVLFFGWERFPEFLNSLADYGKYSVNSPEKLTGLGSLLLQVNVPYSAGMGIGVSLVGSFLLMVILVKKKPFSSIPLETQGALLISLVCINTFAVPLHDLDFVVMALPMALFWLLPPWKAALLFPGLLVLSRASIVANFIGCKPDDPVLLSLALGWCAIVSLFFIHPKTRVTAD